ncbi:MAG TPA: response regulator transcription factor [Anaerolineales bacterium]|jgi:DNA-binding NarL/FixJ family response regulator|nr:response regulator transcription factor [Anaerolineales bacterium]
MNDTPEDLVRIIIVDDHRLFREGVASLLRKVAGLALVGEASSGEDCLPLVEELMPDIVLMDINMPGLGGIEATRLLASRQPNVGVIMLTMLEDDESVFAAISAGARGYVLKDADRGSLIRAIRSVAHGEALLSSAVAQRVLDQFSKLKAQPMIPAQPLNTLAPIFKELTARELEVLKLIVKGCRNREIAAQLVISEKTVGNHISNIFSKLQVNDRSQAILRAIKGGLSE